MRNNSPKTNVISTELGHKLAKDLKAEFYHECSALTREGVNELFHDAIEVVVDNQSNEGHDNFWKCGIGRRPKDSDKCFLL